MGDKKTKSNTGILAIIIVLLLVIIGEVYYMNSGNLSFLSKTEVKKDVENKDSKQADTNKKSEKVEVLAITDKRCGAQCDTAPIIAQLKQIPQLANLEVKTLDYSDKEAKKILKENDINKLPVFLFSNNSVDEIKNYLIETKTGKYSLQVGASFDPVQYEKIAKRELKPKTLELFTMGYCPFGEIAFKALPEIQKTFKDDNLKINVHYIATKTGNGKTAESFQSLHGVPEAEENIRQICINKYYGVDKLIAYAQERYKNADNYGRITDKPEEALKAVGVDVAKINKCVTEGEGAKLLEEDIKLAEELGINASPTWLTNNRYKFGGIKAASIQSQFCENNKDLKGCKNKIETKKEEAGNTPTCGK